MDKWSAEVTNYHPDRSYTDRVAIVYDPTPGGRKNEDGSTSYSLRVPALLVTDWVADRDKVGRDIAGALNNCDEMLAALKDLLAANDAVQLVLCDGPEVPDFDPNALGAAQKAVMEAEKRARAAIAKAEGKA